MQPHTFWPHQCLSQDQQTLMIRANIWLGLIHCHKNCWKRAFCHLVCWVLQVVTEPWWKRRLMLRNGTRLLVKICTSQEPWCQTQWRLSTKTRQGRRCCLIRVWRQTLVTRLVLLTSHQTTKLMIMPTRHRQAVQLTARSTSWFQRTTWRFQGRRLMSWRWSMRHVRLRRCITWWMVLLTPCQHRRFRVGPRRLIQLPMGTVTWFGQSRVTQLTLVIWMVHLIQTIQLTNLSGFISRRMHKPLRRP